MPVNRPLNSKPASKRSAASKDKPPPLPSDLPARLPRQQRLREELVAASLELFSKQGFDATTVIDIATLGGISRRTFFRYFRAKDDVVFHWMDAQGEFVRPVLGARPADEAPLQAMKQTFMQLAIHHESRLREVNFLTHLIFEHPLLRGRYQDENAKWEDEFVRILSTNRRLNDSAAFEMRVQVSIAISAFVVAIRSWAATQLDKPLLPWVEAAFTAVERGANHLVEESVKESGAQSRVAKSRAKRAA